MTSNITRFSKLYLNIARTDIANSFPKNVFVREPNLAQSQIDEVLLKVSM